MEGGNEENSRLGHGLLEFLGLALELGLGLFGGRVPALRDLLKSALDILSDQFHLVLDLLLNAGPDYAWIIEFKSQYRKVWSLNKSLEEYSLSPRLMALAQAATRQRAAMLKVRMLYNDVVKQL